MLASEVALASDGPVSPNSSRGGAGAVSALETLLLERGSDELESLLIRLMNAESLSNDQVLNIILQTLERRKGLRSLFLDFDWATGELGSLAVCEDSTGIPSVPSLPSSKEEPEDEGRASSTQRTMQYNKGPSSATRSGSQTSTPSSFGRFSKMTESRGSSPRARANGHVPPTGPAPWMQWQRRSGEPGTTSGRGGAAASSSVGGEQNMSPRPGIQRTMSPRPGIQRTMSPRPGVQRTMSPPAQRTMSPPAQRTMSPSVKSPRPGLSARPKSADHGRRVRVPKERHPLMRVATEGKNSIPQGRPTSEFQPPNDSEKHATASSPASVEVVAPAISAVGTTDSESLLSSSLFIPLNKGMPNSTMPPQGNLMGQAVAVSKIPGTKRSGIPQGFFRPVLSQRSWSSANCQMGGSLQATPRGASDGMATGPQQVNALAAGVLPAAPFVRAK